VLIAMAVGAIVALSAQLGIAKQSPKIEMFTLGIAALFIVSPWLFAYSALAVATLNAVVSGGVLFTFALLSMRHEYSEMRNIHT